jgi:hypothetical protein
MRTTASQTGTEDYVYYRLEAGIGRFPIGRDARWRPKSSLTFTPEIPGNNLANWQDHSNPAWWEGYDFGVILIRKRLSRR